MTDDTLRLDYLEISPNILASFPKFRPPVDLYVYEEKLGDVLKYWEAEKRLPTARQPVISQLADAGQLFLSRQDYKVYARHLSGNLGLVLVEAQLQGREVAEIFFQGLKARYQEFLDQPVAKSYEALHKDLAILCEYLWADPARARHLRHALVQDYSLANNAVATCFVALGMFLLLFKEAETRHLLDAALGFMLHDLGMSNIPDYVVGKPRQLTREERMRAQEHVNIGESMLRRIGEIPDAVFLCATQHHEKMDGSGYPRGLRGQDIAHLARICAVADAFCAMTSNRVYASSKTPKEAALTLIQERVKFDTAALDALVKYITAPTD